MKLLKPTNSFSGEMIFHLLKAMTNPHRKGYSQKMAE